MGVANEGTSYKCADKNVCCCYHNRRRKLINGFWSGKVDIGTGVPSLGYAYVSRKGLGTAALSDLHNCTQV